MRKIILLMLFALQMAFPIAMIVQKNAVRSRGDLVKFNVQPVDPYDILRGRYLRIGGVPGTQNILVDSQDMRKGQRIYALVELDKNNFGYISDVLLERPKEGIYITSKFFYKNPEDKNRINIQLPFDRYYITEKHATLAEELFNEAFSEEDRLQAHVTVRIRNGRAVLQDMYLDGVEVNEFVRQEIERRKASGKK